LTAASNASDTASALFPYQPNLGSEPYLEKVFYFPSVFSILFLKTTKIRHITIKTAPSSLKLKPDTKAAIKLIEQRTTAVLNMA
jgi:hypothetical protein